jgi:hypothetical protein
MANHEIVTLNNTAAQRLTPPGTHSGMDITLQNVSSSGYVYVGGEGVSAANYGYRILPNHSFSIELPGQHALYAIASAPDTSLAVLWVDLEDQG